MSNEGNGFGYYAFGHFPFGSSDWGEDAIIRSFPETYLEDDTDSGGGLLRRYLLTVKDQMNARKREVDEMVHLVDPNLVSIAILKYLGSTIDLTVDEAEPEDFARTLVNNAVIYYRLKGTRQAYNIRGKISGFEVEIINLYHFDYASYYSFLNPDNVYEPISGLFLTDTEPGSVSGIPPTQQCDYCFTSFIKIRFLVVKQLPSTSSTINFFDRLIIKLRQVIPIHVRDIIFEVAMNVEIEESANIDVPSAPNETYIYVQTPMFPRFDFVPADLVSADLFGTVSGSIEVF